jgi:hypothetical protein
VSMMHNLDFDDCPARTVQRGPKEHAAPHELMGQDSKDSIRRAQLRPINGDDNVET